MKAIVKGRYLHCGRERCWNILGVLEDTVRSGADGRWVRVVRLKGSGWHRREDGAWWPEDLARKRGLPPIKATFIAASVEVDWKLFPRGFDPTIAGQLRGIPSGRPEGLQPVGAFEEGGDALLDPDDVVWCRKCGRGSTVTRDLLACPPAQEAWLRAAGLWRD